MDARTKDGTWPQDCLARAFVEGAKWWQFHHNGSTMFPSERDEAEAEALKNYPLKSQWVKISDDPNSLPPFDTDVLANSHGQTAVVRLCEADGHKWWDDGVRHYTFGAFIHWQKITLPAPPEADTQ